MMRRIGSSTTRDLRAAAVRIGALAIMISTALALPAVGLETRYPVKDGTIADGQFPSPFDGTPETYDWYFYESAPFAGMIARSFDALDRRVFWEYDLSTITSDAPRLGHADLQARGPVPIPGPLDRRTRVRVRRHAAALRESLR